MKYHLRECRKHAKLTQEQVAEALNTVQYQIYKYEAEKQDIPLARAIELAKLYNVSLDVLAGLKEPDF